MIVSTMLVHTDGGKGDGVARGYRLHISNLESRAYTYEVAFFLTPPTSEPVWAGPLTRSVSLSPDSGGAFRRSNGVYVARTSVTVQPHQTVAVAMYPNTERITDLDYVDRVEGYVTVELPVVRDRRGSSPFRPRPQSDRPVRTLLNPETRMAFNSRGYGTLITDTVGRVTGKTSIGGFGFDAIEPIVPATGKAENEIEPNGMWIAHPEAIHQLISSVAAEPGVSSATPAQSEALQTLLDLLCEFDADESTLAELNALLEINHAALRLSRR